MEEITDFDALLASMIETTNEYYAIYKPATGEVIGVYPNHSAANIEYKILISQDLADDVFSGKVALNSCFVDEVDGELQIVQTQTINKIDDILHRITLQEYTDIQAADCTVEYNSETELVTVSLCKKIKNKKIKLNSETELKFLITEYNDPHKIIQVIKTTLDDLYAEDACFQYIGTTKHFSVFTSRIFKNYIFVKK